MVGPGNQNDIFILRPIALEYRIYDQANPKTDFDNDKKTESRLICGVARAKVLNVIP